MFKLLLVLLISNTYAMERVLISCINIGDIKDVGTQVGIIKNEKGQTVLKVIEKGGRRNRTILETLVKKDTRANFNVYVSTEKPMTKIAFVSDWEQSDTPEDEFSTFFELVSEEHDLYFTGMCKTNTDFPWKTKIPN